MTRQGLGRARHRQGTLKEIRVNLEYCSIVAGPHDSGKGAQWQDDQLMASKPPSGIGRGIGRCWEGHMEALAGVHRPQVRYQG